MRDMHFSRLSSVFAFLVTVGALCASASKPIPIAFSSPQSAPALAALAQTYYVREDGGTPQQCNGLSDAAYPGSGTGQACAWDHPFRALPPGGTPVIHGGDTLIVASGSYMLGYGAKGADACEAAGSYDCYMPPIPSGPDSAHPTRILGSGATWPELWGTERPFIMINMQGSSNVEFGRFEITDHSGCVEFHSGGLACNRDTPPFGKWASIGLSASDSSSVYLHDLNIHGLAAGGVNAGRLNNWTVENVRIAGNGSVGWDGDIYGTDADTGVMLFRHWVVEWNGCGETYSETGSSGQPTGCWAQSAGGYGDGVGTGETGGTWIIEDSSFLHNTSDGLDLLYTRLPDSTITLRRVHAEGNAGNQIKTTGPVTIENSVIVGNCGFFQGKPFTYNVDNCRAMGDAVEFDFRPGNTVTMSYSTLASEGDCLVGAECPPGTTCNGTEKVILYNNIFQGATDFLQPFENTCLAYQETFPQNPFDIRYSIIQGTKDTPPCPGSNNRCGVDPGVKNASVSAFDPVLLPSSPAIDAAGGSNCPAGDYTGKSRPKDGNGDGTATCDIGAYEYSNVVLSLKLYLPHLRR